jgi:hypothetical protein
MVAVAEFVRNFGADGAALHAAGPASGHHRGKSDTDVGFGYRRRARAHNQVADGLVDLADKVVEASFNFLGLFDTRQAELVHKKNLALLDDANAAIDRIADL